MRDVGCSICVFREVVDFLTNGGSELEFGTRRRNFESNQPQSALLSDLATDYTSDCERKSGVE